MRPTNKRQDMVFAQRIEFDVLDDDHVVVAGRKNGVVDDRVQVLVIAATQVGHRLGGALWGLDQSLAVGVFADPREDPGKVSFQVIDLHADSDVASLKLPPL